MASGPGIREKSQVGVTQAGVIECCAMIREELLEFCDTAKTKMWGEFLLELVDVLYLVCNLTQTDILRLFADYCFVIFLSPFPDFLGVRGWRLTLGDSFFRLI